MLKNAAKVDRANYAELKRQVKEDRQKVNELTEIVKKLQNDIPAKKKVEIKKQESEDEIYPLFDIFDWKKSFKLCPLHHKNLSILTVNKTQNLWNSHKFYSEK